MHSHAHHSHHGDHGDASGRLGVAMGITAAFMVVEAVTGWWTGSLALMADAGHMFSDASGLGIALVASRLAIRPPDAQRTLGWRRAEVLGAAVNATILMLLSGMILWEGVERIGAPAEIDAGPMLVVATLGMLVNIGMAWMLAQGDRDNLNLRAALWHVLGDLLGSVGAIVAAGLILAFGWTLADAVVSLVIAGIIAAGSIRILREAAEVLMQATPRGVQLDALRETVLREPGVCATHDLHIWSMAPGANVLSLHVVLEPDVDADATRRLLEDRLREMLKLEHVTIQVEPPDSGCRCHPEHEEPTAPDEPAPPEAHHHGHGHGHAEAHH